MSPQIWGMDKSCHSSVSISEPLTVAPRTAQTKAMATNLSLWSLLIILCFTLPGISGESFRVTGTVGKTVRGTRDRWVRWEEGKENSQSPTPPHGRDLLILT